MSKKGGGPKSVEGKARSSQNALKHGITTSALKTAQEKELVAHFTQELMQHYAPTSPLEILQIERIALCRAKLAHLYEVERLQLQLLVDEIDTHPEKVLEQFSYLQDIAKGMVLEKIRFGQLRLPAGLEDGQLQAIVREVLAFQGMIASAKDVQKHLSSLYHFLMHHPDEAVQKAPLLEEKMRLVSEELSRCIARGQNYMEYAWNLFKPALEQERIQAQLEVENNKTSEEIVLEQYIAQVQDQINEERAKYSHKIDLSGPRFPSHAMWMEQLNRFVTIFGHQEQAQKAFEKYTQTKELLKASAQLPSAQSDLLMRYQTTLERRLSSAIGE